MGKFGRYIMDYFIQMRHFTCALFAMMFLNCLEYDWDHFKKENTVKYNIASQSYRLKFGFRFISQYIGYRLIKNYWISFKMFISVQPLIKYLHICLPQIKLVTCNTNVKQIFLTVCTWIYWDNQI